MSSLVLSVRSRKDLKWKFVPSVCFVSVYVPCMESSTTDEISFYFGLSVDLSRSVLPPPPKNISHRFPFE